MAKHKSKYANINVDERLLVFLPHYKAKWLQDNPHLAGHVNDAVLRDALLQSLEAGGAARRTTASDGQLRLVPTEDYLASIKE